ncbi:MAG: hypothetical protein DRP47_06430 [Candidatus Zixiibacteriota bacterium]|nr:MAG: hypothetical protein DRP47_06430 [candidate division Zixibacteria bacterium]
MKYYDVVIVGAGPGGLNCAEKLSSSKLKVLLLEKNITIGPKICGGGITNHAIEYLKLPKDIQGNKFREIRVYNNSKSATMKKKDDFIYTVDREILGQWQLKKLNKENVEIRTDAKVSKITKNYLIVNNDEKIKFKYLVGADGVASIVRKYLKLRTGFGITIQYILPTNKYKKFELHYDSKLFNAWFAWIVPHKNHVSIGCGGHPKILPAKKLNNNFNIWLKKNEIDVSKGEYKAWPIGYNYQGYRFDNIFLVGEAAGLTSPLTGEGIYPALISGEEVAKIIQNEKYVSRIMDKIITTNKLHMRIMNILIKSGPLRKLEFQLFIWAIKSKLFDKLLIDFLL